MPARKRTSDLTILVSAGIATVLLTVAAYLVAPVDSASDVAGSSYSSRPDGAKAAYLLLRQLEYDVERSFEPVAALQADPEATVLVLSEPRRGELRDWDSPADLPLTTARAYRSSPLSSRR